MGPGDAQARRPFPQFSNVYWINPSIGDSSYHSGYVRLERRFQRGVSLLAHYTFSKFLDDVAGADEYGDPGSYMDAYNRRLDKSLSGSDIPQRLVVTALYETPALRKRGVVALGGGRLADRAADDAAERRAVHGDHGSQHHQCFSAGSLRPEPFARPAA